MLRLAPRDGGVIRTFINAESVQRQGTSTGTILLSSQAESTFKKDKPQQNVTPTAPYTDILIRGRNRSAPRCSNVIGCTISAKTKTPPAPTTYILSHNVHKGVDPSILFLIAVSRLRKRALLPTEVCSPGEDNASEPGGNLCPKSEEAIARCAPTNSTCASFGIGVKFQGIFATSYNRWHHHMK